MSTQRKAKSRIFEAVHEGASDLYRLGFIDKRRMAYYDSVLFVCGLLSKADAKPRAA